MENFARGVWKDIPVRFNAPAKEETTPGLYFVLIGLVPDLASRNNHRKAFQIFRRYLVCSTGADAAERARLMEALLFKVMEGVDLRMESEPIPDDLWLALGLVPQCAFVLRVPVTQERQVQNAPPVKIVEIDLNPSGTIRGQVLDEHGEPAANCLVEIPAYQLRTSTGTDGKFQFACVSRATGHKFRFTLVDVELVSEAPAGAGFSEPLRLAFHSHP
jgi:hypothetical protein